LNPCVGEVQYPPGTPEISPAATENLTIAGQGTVSDPAQVEHKRNAFMGSCKHRIWQAIRASSAAPYYLDDYSDGIFLLMFKKINSWQILMGSVSMDACHCHLP